MDMQKKKKKKKKGDEQYGEDYSFDSFLLPECG